MQKLNTINDNLRQLDVAMSKQIALDKIEKTSAERLGVSVEKLRKMTISEVRKRVEEIKGKKTEFKDHPSSMFW